MDAIALLQKTYAAFNARDLDGALAVMHPNVTWPNGMEGGNVYGHGGIREYWTRQWAMIDPSVEPVRFTIADEGRVSVEVHQVVRDLTGRILKDTVVHHVYAFEDGLIKAMEIRDGAEKVQ
jgi:ketosteroid isomerase-like protein